jgi:type III secretion protein HrpB1
MLNSRPRPSRNTFTRNNKSRSKAMPTSLAFRTPVGGVSIPAGQSKELGSVDVHQFSKIRVVADERIGSATGINVRLTITEGSELVAQLDVLSLGPHSQVTRVYDVPARKLTVFADAIGGSGGNDALDVLIYGNA